MKPLPAARDVLWSYHFVRHHSMRLFRFTP
jgi:hypothetical protein